jgi:hypothetical protein
MHQLARFRRALIVPVLCSVWSAGCAKDPPIKPVITFDQVPPAASGGSERTAEIRGRVAGARAGQRIVLFAKAGVWWVQPLTAEPFTRIEADSTWKSRIHLGMEYAALLVDGDYHPPDTVEILPEPGKGVIAVAVARGTGDFTPLSPRRTTFSGYDWDVRFTPSDRGGANEYDPANAWVDAQGLMHLALVQRDGRWTSAEVILTRALGYGTYTFTVRDTSTIDPAAAFGMFTWDEENVQQNHRELDIEISHWGDHNIPNAQFVVQPYYVPANVARFSIPSGTVTHTLRWEPGRALFKTFRGASAEGAIVAQHEFTSGVPMPGNERVRMNLYYFRYSPSAPRGAVEVVIERFQYIP